MVESCLPMREPGTGAIGVLDQRKVESGCLVHAGQGAPEVKDDREAKHLRVELGTDTKVRGGQTDMVYSTQGQGRVVGSCRRFVRLLGRRRHKGFLPLQRSIQGLWSDGRMGISGASTRRSPTRRGPA